MNRDLRTWLNEVDKIGELKHVEGVDWNLGMVKDYRKGCRVLLNAEGTLRRLAISIGTGLLQQTWGRSLSGTNLQSDRSSHPGLRQCRSRGPSLYHWRLAGHGAG